jgi:hypothetical protein
MRMIVGWLLISCLAGCGSDTVAATGESSSETSGGDGVSACGLDRWEPAAPPLVARRGHQAVLLADGRVLVNGGYGLDVGDPFASGEIWDPVSDEWTAIADMPSPRLNHALVVVEDGTVLAIGGDPLTPVDRWDPNTDAWSEVGSLPVDMAIGDAIAAPAGGVLVVGYPELFRSDDLGESWTAIEAPPRQIFTQYVFRWDVDSIVFAVVANDGQDLVHPVLFYDWSEGVWIDGPILELDPYVGYGDLNAWGPLSDSKLAIVRSRQGNDPDPYPPPASFTHELRVGSPWDVGTEEGPYFGNSGHITRAEPFWPGWLWMDRWTYEDETNTWCRTADPELSLSGLETVVLPDGRILFTGQIDDVEPPTAVALLWSP